MDAFEIRIEEGDEVPRRVRLGIGEADPPDVRPRDWEAVCLSVRDGEGAVAGGVYGATMWGWLMIDGLWVDDALRGRGYGSRLLLAAEEIAIRRGCRGCWLGTFDFQARAFYESHGYTVFAELPGFPAGHGHYHLKKDFPAAPPSSG